MNPVYCSAWRLHDLLTIRNLCPRRAVIFTERRACATGSDAGRFTGMDGRS